MEAGPAKQTVRVTIFNQTYTLVASEEPGEVEKLAQMVDEVMTIVASRAGNVDATRVAVLACLHLADQLRSHEREIEALRRRVEEKAKEFSLLLDEAITNPRS